MRRIAILIGILFIIAGIPFGFLASNYMERRTEVRAACTRFDPNTDFESWTGCVARVALEKQDADYCWTTGDLFSSAPELCMSVVALKTKDPKICETIFKPEPRSRCENKFNTQSE